jgi:hypothetical protein
MVNTFNVHKTVHKEEEDVDGGRALTWYLILEVVLPSINHSKDEIRNASTKILVDVQKKTGLITQDALEELSEKIRDSVWEKIQSTEIIQPSASPVKGDGKK